MRLLALDIETVGLQAEFDPIVAIGFATAADTWSFAKDDEMVLLRELGSTIASQPPDTVLVTWNGEEFDLPFIAQRYRFHGLGYGPRLAPKKDVGKYGGRTFRASWLGLSHIDIAPLFREFAVARGVDWSLKPVAKAALGVTPIEVDRRGSAIQKMSRADVQAYVESDARITFELATRLNGITKIAQARST